jgi:hypothetical protein
MEAILKKIENVKKISRRDIKKLLKKRKITPMKGTIQPPRQPDRRPLPANMRKTPRGTTRNNTTR